MFLIPTYSIFLSIAARNISSSAYRVLSCCFGYSTERFLILLQRLSVGSRSLVGRLDRLSLFGQLKSPYIQWVLIYIVWYQRYISISR